MLAVLQKDCVSIPGPDKVWAADGPDDICTVRLCSQTNAARERLAQAPSARLSINYIWLCQINCMELFAADRKQVDSGVGWGGGWAGCRATVLWIVIVCLPCPFLPLLVCSCASDWSCKLRFWTQTQIALS